MPAATSRASSIAARLTAATGTPARTRTETDHIRVEATIPHTITAPRWREVLTALADADRYGQTEGAEGSTVWATITLGNQ